MTATDGTDDDRVVKVCEPCMVSLKDSEVEKCPECGGELSPIRAVQDDYVGTVVNDEYFRGFADSRGHRVEGLVDPTTVVIDRNNDNYSLQTSH
jgi:hypothetical protein